MIRAACDALYRWAIFCAFSLQLAVAADGSATPTTLEALAAEADLIALAQSRDTDYFYRRDFPVSGSAYLKSLIAYKLDRRVDIIEVFEEGLHANECYFPETTVLEEGRRYLLFLRTDPDDPERYRGLSWGCALEVLVSSDGSYALRYPLTGGPLADQLVSLVEPINFADSYAVVSEEDITPADRDAWLSAGWLERREVGYKFTHGIPLGAFRQLINPESLTSDRHLKRQPPPALD